MFIANIYILLTKISVFSIPLESFPAEFTALIWINVKFEFLMSMTSKFHLKILLFASGLENIHFSV